MPLYSYRCSACHSLFELLVRASDEPACPSCGGARLERQISTPAPEGKTAGIVSSARSQAAREGHFSNYSAAERPRR